MFKNGFLLMCFAAVPFSGARAQGPPCWDSVPPSAKYDSHHTVAGDVGPFAPSDTELTQTLAVDGVNVSTRMIDGNSYLEVEIIVTNCSAKTVQIGPKDFSLAVLTPNGDKILAPLDPTHFVQFPKTGKTFPSLNPEALPYGRIGVFRTFFTRDGNAKSSDRMHSNYSLRMTVSVENWHFEFTFPRRKMM